MAHSYRHEYMNPFLSNNAEKQLERCDLDLQHLTWEETKICYHYGIM